MSCGEGFDNWINTIPERPVQILSRSCVCSAQKPNEMQENTQKVPQPYKIYAFENDKTAKKIKITKTWDIDELVDVKPYL